MGEALQSIKFAMARLLVAISLGVILISLLAVLFRDRRCGAPTACTRWRSLPRC
jgi:hypothetical protein